MVLSLAVVRVAVATGFSSVQLQTVTVVEVVSTKGDSSAPFGSVTSMLGVGPGSVLVSDDKQRMIHRWNTTNGRVAPFARTGQGPGEVQTPVLLAARPGGGVAVYDVSNGLLLFDRGLRFDRRVVLRGGIVSNPKSMAVLSDSSVLISGGRISDPRHIHHYSPRGDLLASFGEPSAKLTSQYARIQTAGGAVRALPTGFLYSAGTPLRILRFPRNDFASPSLLMEDPRLLPEITEATVRGPATPQSRGNPTFLWWHDRSTGVFALPDGRILNVVTRFYRGDSVWDLYTPEGKHLARGILPRAYHAWDLAADGSVLASYRDRDTDEHVAVVLRVMVR